MNDRDTIISNMLKAATVENERLRAALKPFADIADLVNHTERRDGERVFELPRKPPAVGYFTLVREDFRRAAKALEQRPRCRQWPGTEPCVWPKCDCEQRPIDEEMPRTANEDGG